LRFATAGTWHPIGDASLCATAGTPITIGDARYRERGLGTQVLALLIDRAKSLGWAEMVVSGIYTDNPRARRLYERAGFRITGTVPAEAGRSQWTMLLPCRIDRPRPLTSGAPPLFHPRLSHHGHSWCNRGTTPSPVPRGGAP